MYYLISSWDIVFSANLIVRFLECVPLSPLKPSGPVNKAIKDNLPSYLSYKTAIIILFLRKFSRLRLDLRKTGFPLSPYKLKNNYVLRLVS